MPTKAIKTNMSSREAQFEQMLHRIIRKNVTKEEFDLHMGRADFPSYEDLLKEDESARQRSAFDYEYQSEDEDDESNADHESHVPDDGESNASYESLQEFFNTLDKEEQGRVRKAYILLEFKTIDEIEESAIKTRYRKQALLCHPDRPGGGNIEKFKCLEAARTTLVSFVAFDFAHI